MEIEAGPAERQTRATKRQETSLSAHSTCMISQYTQIVHVYQEFHSQLASLYMCLPILDRALRLG